MNDGNEKPDISDETRRILESGDGPPDSVLGTTPTKMHDHKACTPEAIAQAKKKGGLMCEKLHDTVVLTQQDGIYVCCTCGQIGDFFGFVRIER